MPPLSRIGLACTCRLRSTAPLDSGLGAIRRFIDFSSSEISWTWIFFLTQKLEKVASDRQLCRHPILSFLARSFLTIFFPACHIDYSFLYVYLGSEKQNRL